MQLKTIAAIDKLLAPYDRKAALEILQFLLNRFKRGSTAQMNPVHEPVQREVQSEVQPLVQLEVQNDLNQVRTDLNQVVQPDFEQKVLVSRFLEFWSVYPKKQGKQDALRIYRRLKPNQELQDRILHAVLQQKASEQWNKENGQFIPLPKTWLNRGSWDDEPSSEPRSEPRFGRTEPRVFKRFIDPK
jgi:hypothetical protein